MSQRMNVTDEAMQELLQRPLTETSTDELALLFAGGAKDLDQWMLGLELEVFGHDLATRAPATYPRLRRVLESLAAHLGWRQVTEGNGDLVGLEGEGQIVSLEPGGQLEYATRPYRALRKLRREVTELIGALSQAARDEGLGLWAIGHHPYADRDDVPKMPKTRYDLMRAYMPKRGDRALDMMHLTGSVQCAVDFSDEQNMVDKVATAARVSPFLAALTAASPFTKGAPNGYRSMRYEIWRHTDNARCGLWPEMVDGEGLTFRRYVEHALNVPAMLFVRDDAYRIAEPIPYAEIARRGFEDSTVTVADFVDHLTTLFPEIRTKSYIELRGADCAPPVEAVAIAGFWRGLLDDEPTRLAAAERLAPLDFAALDALQPQVAKIGLDAKSPIGEVREIVRWLVTISYERLAKSAPDCGQSRARPRADRPTEPQRPSRIQPSQQNRRPESPKEKKTGRTA